MVQLKQNNVLKLSAISVLFETDSLFMLKCMVGLDLHFENCIKMHINYALKHRLKALCAHSLIKTKSQFTLLNRVINVAIFFFTDFFYNFGFVLN